MSEQWRTARSLLTEKDEGTIAGATPQLTSIRDADWRHQRAAMIAGYNSLTDYAIDDLLGRLAELIGRVDRLEQLVAELSGPTVVIDADTSVPWPVRPEIAEDK